MAKRRYGGGHSGLIPEKILVRDFYGQIVETIAVLANGDFHGSRGVIARNDLGVYILSLLRHVSSPMKQAVGTRDIEPRQEPQETTDKE